MGKIYRCQIITKREQWAQFLKFSVLSQINGKIAHGTINHFINISFKQKITMVYTFLCTHIVTPSIMLFIGIILLLLCLQFQSRDYWWSILPIPCINPHYSDVLKSTMESQTAGGSIVYSSVCSGADQRKQQSSAALVFVRGIHRSPMNSPHKGPVTRKMFPLMTSSCADAIAWKCISHRFVNDGILSQRPGEATFWYFFVILNRMLTKGSICYGFKTPITLVPL